MRWGGGRFRRERLEGARRCGYSLHAEEQEDPRVCVLSYASSSSLGFSFRSTTLLIQPPTHSLATALLAFLRPGARRRTRLWSPFEAGRVVNELKDPARAEAVIMEDKERSGSLYSQVPPTFPRPKVQANSKTFSRSSFPSRPVASRRVSMSRLKKMAGSSRRLFGVLHAFTRTSRVSSKVNPVVSTALNRRYSTVHVKEEQDEVELPNGFLFNEKVCSVGSILILSVKTLYCRVSINFNTVFCLHAYWASTPCWMTCLAYSVKNVKQCLYTALIYLHWRDSHYFTP